MSITTWGGSCCVPGMLCWFSGWIQGMQKGWAALKSLWCFWRMLLPLMDDFGAGSALLWTSSSSSQGKWVFYTSAVNSCSPLAPSDPRADHSSRLELGSPGWGPAPICAAGRFYFSARQLSRTFLYKKLQKRSEQLSLSSSISSA